MDEPRTSQQKSNADEPLWPAMSVWPAAQEYFGRLFGLSQSYVDLAQRFAESGDTSEVVHHWLHDMEQLWRPAEETNEALDSSQALWALPIDTWQRVAASLLPSSGDALRAVKAEGMQGAVGHRLDQFLSMPAIGYARETQEQNQRYARLVLRYVATLNEYYAALARLGLRSIEAFRQRLTEPGDHPPVQSVRGLYDLWVDTFEAEYVKYAKSSEHSELYGRLVNALSAVKREASAITEKALDSMNMPTRREIDSVQRYLHDLRREARTARRELASLREQTASHARTAEDPNPAHRNTKHH